MRRLVETSPFRFEVVSSGPGAHILRPYIEHLGIPFYHSLVQRADLPAVYDGIDVFLCTSELEGGPMTVLEALACGVPCVSTPVGLVPDAILDGRNGFVVDLNDIEAFVAAARDLVDNPTRYETFSGNARSHAVATLRWETTLAGVRRFYITALADCESSPAGANGGSFRNLAEAVARDQAIANHLHHARYLARLGYFRYAIKELTSCRSHHPAGPLLRGVPMLFNAALRKRKPIHGKAFLKKSLG
jgi:hypothetical protein